MDDNNNKVKRKMAEPKVITGDCIQCGRPYKLIFMTTPPDFKCECGTKYSFSTVNMGKTDVRPQHVGTKTLPTRNKRPPKNMNNEMWRLCMNTIIDFNTWMLGQIVDSVVDAATDKGLDLQSKSVRAKKPKGKAGKDHN